MPVKSKVEILQNFVTFSQYMNFKRRQDYHLGYLINHNWERGGGSHQNLMGGGVTTWDKCMYPIWVVLEVVSVLKGKSLFPIGLFGYWQKGFSTPYTWQSRTTWAAKPPNFYSSRKCRGDIFINLGNNSKCRFRSFWSYKSWYSSNWITKKEPKSDDHLSKFDWNFEYIWGLKCLYSSQI